MAATDKAPTGFEGPEKVLELDFVPDQGNEDGLFCIEEEEWKVMLAAAKCGVLSVVKNSKFHSYVLSESSMFVYPHKLIVKTCGTTTLLRMLPLVQERISKAGMAVEWMAYSRKDYSFPAEQLFPHRGIGEEVEYLQKIFPEGSAYILGPITADHWLVFVADYCERPSSDSTDRTLNIMMYDIDPAVADMFQADYKGSKLTATDVTKLTGIGTLMPGSVIQDYLFEPCGYSMNGLLFEAYWTIHVTPESHCSYASFETNIRTSNFNALVRAVLGVFRPARFSVTLFADKAGLAEMTTMPFPSLYTPSVSSKHPFADKRYVLLAKSKTEFAGDYCSFLGNYTAVNKADVIDPVTGKRLISSVFTPVPESADSPIAGDVPLERKSSTGPFMDMQTAEGTLSIRVASKRDDATTEDSIGSAGSQANTPSIRPVSGADGNRSLTDAGAAGAGNRVRVDSFS